MMNNKIHFTWVYDDSSVDLKSLKEFLLKDKGISRRMLADIKYKGGEILVDGVEKTVRYFLQVGDHIQITLPPEPVSKNITSISIPFERIFEDDHLLIINKPASLVTVPSRNKHEPSLAGAVLHYYQSIGWPATFHAVNRLDRGTSGLMIVAKHRYAHELLFKQQKKTEIQRKYVALVKGKLPWSFGSIDAPIARKQTSIIEREVSHLGQRAITHYECLQRAEDVSVVELSLDTGRTHQIRVHMAWLGNPLIGDTLYGGPKCSLEFQALHSAQLAFRHPFTKQIHHYHLNMPGAFQEMISEKC